METRQCDTGESERGPPRIEIQGTAQSIEPHSVADVRKEARPLGS